MKIIDEKRAFDAMPFTPSSGHDKSIVPTPLMGLGGMSLVSTRPKNENDPGFADAAQDVTHAFPDAVYSKPTALIRPCNTYTRDLCVA